MLSSTFEIVVPQHVKYSPEVLECQFVRFQKSLLAGVHPAEACAT